VTRIKHRWDEPVIPLDHWQDTEHVQIRRDGTVMELTVFKLKERDMKRIHQGYVCCRCFNPHERPFPPSCTCCRFPMRDYQTETVAKQYRETTRDNHSCTAVENLQSELDELRAEVALRNRINELTSLGLYDRPTILVPRGIVAP